MKLRIARDFDLLWAGESISALGTQLSTLALPTLAILDLHASAFEVGVLAACSFGGYPVAGILGGPSIDRLPRRAVMLATNGVRAAVLFAIPLAALAGQLALWQLYIAGLGVSAATALFDTAYQAHLPSLVPAERLLGANARLETSQNVAYFAGPGVAGVLIQAIGAVATIAGDALSYVWSFAMVALIHPEGRVATAAPRRSVVGELQAGIALYRSYPYLPSLGLCVAISNARSLSGYVTTAHRLLRRITHDRADDNVDATSRSPPSTPLYRHVLVYQLQRQISHARRMAQAAEEAMVPPVDAHGDSTAR